MSQDVLEIIFGFIEILRRVGSANVLAREREREQVGAGEREEKARAGYTEAGSAAFLRQVA